MGDGESRRRGVALEEWVGEGEREQGSERGGEVGLGGWGGHARSNIDWASDSRAQQVSSGGLKEGSGKKIEKNEEVYTRRRIGRGKEEWKNKRRFGDGKENKNNKNGYIEYRKGDERR